MDGVNEPDENGKISNLLDPDAEKQTFGRKSQNWSNLKLIQLIVHNFTYIPYLEYRDLHNNNRHSMRKRD
ncbi:hypothetical protein Hanom_Chr13g01194601 [Helianthus anomalus]